MQAPLKLVSDFVFENNEFIRSCEPLPALFEGLTFALPVRVIGSVKTVTLSWAQKACVQHVTCALVLFVVSSLKY